MLQFASDLDGFQRTSRAQGPVKTAMEKEQVRERERYMREDRVHGIFYLENSSPTGRLHFYPVHNRIKVTALLTVRDSTASTSGHRDRVAKGAICYEYKVMIYLGYHA